MLTKRIVPCLDIREGRVVKGKNFGDICDVGDPVELAEFYNAEGADELVFYDIAASFEQRAVFVDVLAKVAASIFIPLTVGGGINTVADFDRVLKAGADKVSVNTGALRNPGLISEAARKYGNQCVVLSVDVKKVEGRYEVFANGGREKTGIDAMEWIRSGEKNGAGEVVVNSIDADGVKSGFDLEMLCTIRSGVYIPIVASGGAGKMEDFLKLFSLDGIEAGLAASIFHYKEIRIQSLKRYLSRRDIPVRL